VFFHWQSNRVVLHGPAQIIVAPAIRL
jgi:hypothetical protein